MVRRMRRSDNSVRLEMMPLLDVVFLLLTFFIYAMVVMVRADALSIGLAPVGGGERVSEAGAVQHVVGVELDGSLSYNREAVDWDGLEAVLGRLASGGGDGGQATVFVTLRRGELDAGGAGVDRGLVVWELLQRIERAGLVKVVMVGTPAAGDAGRD